METVKRRKKKRMRAFKKSGLEKRVEAFMLKWGYELEVGNLYIKGSCGSPDYLVRDRLQKDTRKGDDKLVGRVADSTVEGALRLGYLSVNRVPDKGRELLKGGAE